MELIENIFSIMNEIGNEDRKTKYPISVMSEQALEWWELIKKNNENNIITFDEFRRRVLE